MRADRQILERDVPRDFVNLSLQVLLAFHRGELGAHETNNNFLVLWHEAQRLETAGSFGIVFQEVGVHIQFRKNGIGDEIIAPACEERALEIAAA